MKAIFNVIFLSILFGRSETFFLDENPFFLQQDGRQLQDELAFACSYDDKDFKDPKLYCNTTARYTGDNGTYADVNVKLTCNSTSSTLDYREAGSCECNAEITDQDGLSKNCTCGVCAKGFGTNPIYFDCGDDTLLDECSVVECNFGCNGPCIANCDVAGEVCELCVNVTEAPTEPEPGPGPVNVIIDYIDASSECSQEQGRMTCTSESFFTASGGYRSNLAVSVECDATVGIWDYQKSRNCLCSVNVTDLSGQPVGQDCECTVCPSGFGANPISVTCHNSSVIAGCATVDCNSRCNGACESGCQADGEDCLLCAPKVPVDRNTTVDECQATEDQLICNRKTRVTAPNDEDIYSDLDIGIQCDLVDPGDLDFHTAANCSCTVNVTDHEDNPRNCGCSICSDGFGSNDIAFLCEDDFVVGECYSIDCDFACNGSCKVGCDESGPDCQLCHGPDPSVPTPTLGPDATSPPTKSPVETPAPTPVITSTLTEEEQTYSYDALTVRLEGGKEINDVTKAVFASTTEQFYRFIFQPRSEARRRLETVEFTSFDTEVRAQDQALDANGNTITYGQSIRFRMESGFLDEDQALELLLWQMKDSDTKQIYLEMLRKAHVDFLSITEVNPDPSRSTTTDDDSEGLDMLIIILIGVGALVCCCCCIVFLVVRKRGNKEDEKLAFHQEGEVPNNDYDYPEAPIHNTAEKQDPSDHTDFSNDNERNRDKSIGPIGEGDDESFDDGFDDGEDDDSSSGSRDSEQKFV